MSWYVYWGGRQEVSVLTTKSIITWPHLFSVGIHSNCITTAKADGCYTYAMHSSNTDLL